jgi:hypothetical protein
MHLGGQPIFKKLKKYIQYIDLKKVGVAALTVGMELAGAHSFSFFFPTMLWHPRG